MRKMKYRLCACALVVITVFANMMVSYGAEPKPTTEGVVTFQEGDAAITLQGNEEQSLNGKTFELHQLFEVENAANLESVQYTWKPQYENALRTVVAARLEKEVAEITEYEVLDYMQSLAENSVSGAGTEQKNEGSYSAYRYFAEELLAQIQLEGVSGKTIQVNNVRQNNSITIKGLEYGYYMITEQSEINGKHTAASMTMLSTANPTSQIHIKSDYPTVTKKIQENDVSDPMWEKISWEGWNDYADFEIGSNVNYRFDSIVPNMNGYDTYYFAFHDRMDDALALKEYSISVELLGPTKHFEKIYELEKGEYNLLKNVDGETFVVEIPDLKTIVDREYPNVDENGEHIYGQEVSIFYSAELTDAAAADTGRPGFENDVRLEYSNNPNSGGEDSRGFTPWDTVVCFTYKLEGIKINEYDEALSDAEFALYRDEDCTQEVAVKQVGNAYHVMQVEELIEPVSVLSETTPEKARIISQNDGTFDIYGLDSGVYYLKETKAPEGYRPLLEPIELVVTAEFPQDRNNYAKGDGAKEETLQLSATAKIEDFVLGQARERVVELETDQMEGGFQVSVVNTTGKKLPVTGSRLMPVFLIAGISCMGLALRKGKKLDA